MTLQEMSHDYAASADAAVMGSGANAASDLCRRRYMRTTPLPGDRFNAIDSSGVTSPTERSRNLTCGFSPRSRRSSIR